MKIKFLKDHLDHKKGDVTEHKNAEYLIRVGVAQEVKREEKPKKKK